MSQSKQGKVTIVEVEDMGYMGTNTYETRREMIIDLCKSGGTFKGLVGYATPEHVEGIENLIDDLKDVRDEIAKKVKPE